MIVSQTVAQGECVCSIMVWGCIMRNGTGHIALGCVRLGSFSLFRKSTPLFQLLPVQEGCSLPTIAAKLQKLEEERAHGASSGRGWESLASYQTLSSRCCALYDTTSPALSHHTRHHSVRRGSGTRLERAQSNASSTRG